MVRTAMKAFVLLALLAALCIPGGCRASDTPAATDEPVRMHGPEIPPDGMAYDEYIRKNILEPLDLTELFPDNDHLTSNGRTDLKLIHFDFPHQDVTLSYSVGVMTGTAEGLLEWEKCVLDRKLLSSESWDKIFDGGQFGYGYGWTIVGDGVVEHSGMTLGYNTNVRINLKDRKVIIVLSNIQPLSGSKSRPLSSEIGDKLWEMF